MGICLSKAAAGELDDDEGLGFPWMHDDLFHSHLWTSAGVSVHTKQGWKGANQDAMTVSQVHDLTLPSLCLYAVSSLFAFGLAAEPLPIASSPQLIALGLCPTRKNDSN